LLSPDGTRLYVPNGTALGIAVLNTADGSLVSTIPVTGLAGDIGDAAGMVWHPSGDIIFSYNVGFAATSHGLYRLNTTTGAATPFLLLPSLGLSYNTTGPGAGYLYAYAIAAHPGGDGLVFALQRYNGTYHSELVEVAWDGTVGNIYNYVASGLDGQRLAMFFAVCYSTDGAWLYAVGDTSWSIIWRFARGSGSVGGNAPWMQVDCATRADWVAGGSPHNWGGPNELWESVIAGIAAIPGCNPPNDNFADAQVVVGTDVLVTGSIVCATAEPGETTTSGSTVWYSWTPSEGTARASFSEVFYATDTEPMVRVWTGDDVGALTLVVEHGAAVPGPAVWDVVVGTTYHIQVDHTRAPGDEPYLGPPNETSTFVLALSVECEPPDNDDFTGATVLIGDRGSLVAEPIACATLQTDEPDAVSAETIWYDWTPRIPGVLQVDTAGSADANVVEVFIGHELPSLTLVASSETDPEPVERGAMLGWHTDGGHAQFVADGESLGKPFAVERIYQDPSNWGTVKAVVRTSLLAQRLPMSSHRPPNTAGIWAAIASGSQDGALASLASAYNTLAADFPGREVLFIFHHEPHDESTLKAGGTNGTPAEFVGAFRHVVDYMRANGPAELVFGYCAVDSWASDYPADQLYPGDDWVDVLCHDYYNWGSYKASGWQQPAAKFGSLLDIARATGKPVLPGEVGCHPSEGGHSRNQWFIDLARFIKGLPSTGDPYGDPDASRYFVGFCYYHVDNHNGSGHYWGFVDKVPDDGETGWVGAFTNDDYFHSSPIPATPSAPTGSGILLSVSKDVTYHIRVTRQAP
jgi:hypothetical protein